MAKTNLKKNAEGYGYNYTDLSEIHNYLEGIGATYYQYIEPIDGNDYIMTVPIIDGEEKPPRRGCRVINATLSGKSNPAQENGSALTYARRYSLLMAFGLSTTDDDAACLTVEYITTEHAEEIKNALQETDSNVPAFLSLFQAKSVDEMYETQYPKAIEMLNKKRQKMKGDK